VIFRNFVLLLATGLFFIFQQADIYAEERESKALAHYTMGIIYDNKGKTDFAIREYRKSLKYNPHSALTRLKLGVDYLVLGKEKRAVKEFQSVKSSDPKNLQARFLLALVHTSQGRFIEAEKEYEKIIEYNPEDLVALVSLADILVIQEKMREAEALYKKLIEKKEDNPALYFNLAIIETQLGKDDEALLRVDKAIKLFPEYLEARMLGGVILESKGNYEKAAENYKRVLDADPLNTVFHVRLARCYQKTGRIDDAIREHKIALSISPDKASPYLALSRLYIEEEKFAEARGLLEKASVKFPENAPVFFYTGVIHEKMGNTRAAVENFRKTVELDPAFAQAYNYIGYIFAEDGENLDEAIELINKAIALEPENPAYIDSLGWAYFKKEMTEKAVKELEKAARISERDPVIRAHLGDAYFKKGLFDKAMAQWKKALELDPKQDGVRKKLKILTDRYYEGRQSAEGTASSRGIVPGAIVPFGDKPPSQIPGAKE